MKLEEDRAAVPKFMTASINVRRFDPEPCYTVIQEPAFFMFGNAAASAKLVAREVEMIQKSREIRVVNYAVFMRLNASSLCKIWRL